MDNYANKTIAELKFIQQDAFEAAQCAQVNGDGVAEAKYLDQVNDACTALYRLTKGA